MKKLLTAQRMKQLDEMTTEKLGISSAVLMERAALFSVETILYSNYNLSNVAILCGLGNNGGDGVAIARILKEHNISSDIFVIGDISRMNASVKEQLIAIDYYRINKYTMTPSEADAFLYGHYYTTIIDAMFGNGLSRDLTSDYCLLIDRINSLKDTSVISIDIPTGVNATNGHIMGNAIKADSTVTFGYYKRGHFLYPGASYCGNVFCDTIGILQDKSDNSDDIYAIEQTDLARLKRPDYSNKGTFGKILIIAGSKDVGGAAVLSTMSAFEAGAGMVMVYTHENNRELILQAVPEAMVTTYTDNNDKLSSAIAWADVVAIGPGIGTNELSSQMLKKVMDSAKPIILDADALMILKNHIDFLQNHDPKQSIIITPHIGEFAKLFDYDKEEVISDIIKCCKETAAKYNIICLLKDSRSVISDGKTTYLNVSGNNGLATAGSGDVLLGLVASLLGQTKDPLISAAFAAYLHGATADLCAKSSGKASLKPSDLPKRYRELLPLIS